MIPVILYLILLLGFSEPDYSSASDGIFKTETGKVGFVSKASLENIKATSDKLRGVIDINSRRLAFTVPVSTFEGFNSPLQKTHFNENYLQTAIFPNANFEGKLIDVVSLQKDGTYNVKSVGKLTIHGVGKEIMVS
ncbi:MAG: YceI family protein [Bacteroidia bacterium]|nr:YceI family protein [Bacteroidia bacterium]